MLSSPVIRLKYRKWGGMITILHRKTQNSITFSMFKMILTVLKLQWIQGQYYGLLGSTASCRASKHLLVSNCGTVYTMRILYTILVKPPCVCHYSYMYCIMYYKGKMFNMPANH